MNKARHVPGFVFLGIRLFGHCGLSSMLLRWLLYTKFRTRVVLIEPNLLEGVVKMHLTIV